MAVKKRSEKVKAEEAERVRLGAFALREPDPVARSHAIVELVAAESASFLERREKKIQGLKLSDLNINPYGLRLASAAMELETPEEVIDHLVDATLHAGIETAYGWLMDLMIPPYFGATTPPEREDPVKYRRFKEFDKQIVKDEGDGPVRYLISIKSGPMTINDTMAREMHENVKAIVEVSHDRVVYAVTYGWEGLLSNKPGIVKGDFGDEHVRILVGREYWDWLAGYEGAYLDVYRGIEAGLDVFAQRRGASLRELLASKKAVLVDEFERLFGLEGAETDLWRAMGERGFTDPARSGSS